MRDMLFFFFFSSRRRHTRCYRDWSSDVCSSDLIALWRDLRKAGAISLGQSAWALPDVPAVQPVLERVERRTATAGGELLRLAADGLTPADADRLAAMYESARAEEWREFLAAC